MTKTLPISQQELDLIISMIKDTKESVLRVEDKVDDKFKEYKTMIVSHDDRLNKVESKLDNLLGKAALGMLVFISVFGTAVALLVEWVKGKFK